MSVRVFAPAKVNLTLQVGRPRADGLHPLQSIVVFADVGDWIEAAPGESLSLAVTGPFASALAGDRDNLVLRAARALAARIGVAHGAALALDKQLPVASGLGGGSSDAAATLKALNQLWRAGLSQSELAALAAEIGADVAVCLSARPAWMTGAGEVVTPISLPEAHAVLVNPLEALSTAAVYREFDRLGLGGAFVETRPPLWRGLDDLAVGAAALGNDLGPPARMLLPAVAEVEAALRHDARVLYAALSGSGATCFALVQDAAAASALAADLGARRRDWWVCAARLGAA
jgi:4-diphosphocytidyl-2-C-methyl-D-erythritol kinase